MIVRSYIKSKVFPILLILLFSTPAFADLQKGFDAYEKGDYATALKEQVESAATRRKMELVD